MKTPWRFLADLVLRRSSSPRSAETVRPETKALEYHPAESVIIPEPPATAETQPPAVTETTTVVVVAGDDVRSTIADLESSTAEHHEVIVIDALKRGDKLEAFQSVSLGDLIGSEGPTTDQSESALVEQEVAKADFGAAVPAPTQLTEREEMLALDRDINELRSKLTRKLTEQNAIMRALLERYDRH